MDSGSALAEAGPRYLRGMPVTLDDASARASAHRIGAENLFIESDYPAPTPPGPLPSHCFGCHLAWLPGAEIDGVGWQNAPDCFGIPAPVRVDR